MAYLLFASALLSGTAAPETGIYFGKADGSRKPAVVSARKVFLNIEEYRTIVEKGLTPNDPQYYTLLAEANRKFYGAVQKAAAARGYDCIAEEGRSFDPAPADATQEVIGSLKKP
jgi:hypothetical protein